MRSSKPCDARDQFTRRTDAKLPHQPCTVAFDSARTHAKRLCDLLARLTGDEQLYDFALASGNPHGHGSFRRDVFERPDGAYERIATVEGLPADMAPEPLAISAAHDALVTVRTGALHDRVGANTDVAKLSVGDVKGRQRLPVQLFGREAEDASEGAVADLNDPLTRNAQAYRRQVEGQRQAMCVEGCCRGRDSSGQWLE